MDVFSLYLVTDSGLADARKDGMSLESIVGNAVEGGVSIVQLREKNLDTAEFIRRAERLKHILDKYGVPLIINDNVEVALACRADGVHLGQSDMKYAKARKLLGPDKIIGLSIETMDELEEANRLDVDYVAASPVFSTPTKTDTARPWGLDGLKKFVAASRHPVIAIGGINGTNIARTISCGAEGAAVVSAIMSAPSPKESAENLAKIIADTKQAGLSCHDLGEFGLIGRIKDAFSGMAGCAQCGQFTGIGDDCAILSQRSGRQTLVSTDMLVEGVHFLMDDVKATDLGWKSAAVNISDIAAMGGIPVATLLSFALPEHVSAAWVDGFIEGYKACCARFGVPLLGGDTTSSPDGLCISVTALGECASGKAKLRSAARPGDLICVTGCLGDSAGGLQVILNGIPRIGAAARLVEKHYRPMPRTDAGATLAEYDGVHAMMDISDGIASDLRHILEESAVSAVIHTDMVPVSDDLVEVFGNGRNGAAHTPLQLALGGGEDYELLFTVSPETEKMLGNVRHYIIGEITDMKGGAPTLEWSGSDSDFTGYSHF